MDDSNTAYNMDDSNLTSLYSEGDYYGLDEYSGHSFDYAELYFYYRFYEFELPVYLYIWEILVILTTIVNILVMLVLKRKSMRSSTNVILMAVAVSDSLTGVVTLPTYIYAFRHNEGAHLKLSKGWCEAFMISKLFVSKAFHTMSIWFTVCLVLQRFMSVSWPFKTQSVFTIKKTLMMIAIIAVLSPVLHVYHLTNKKASSNLDCAWRIASSCKEDCAYLWMTFLFMHFIPCSVLVILTTLMICIMCHTEEKVHDSHLITSKRTLKRRAAQNRRISVIVVAVAIVFLIPEIPYGVFLLISVSLKHSGEELMTLDKNRAFHCAYEILLVLSFHANFWVYIAVNKKFRSGLKRTFEPCLIAIFRCLKVCGVRKEIQRSPSMSSSSGEIQRGTEQSSTRTQTLSVRSTQSSVEMKTFCSKSYQPVAGTIEEVSQEKRSESQAINGPLEDVSREKNSENQPANGILEEVPLEEKADID